MYFKIINQSEKDNTTEQVNDENQQITEEENLRANKNMEQCSNSLVIRKTCKINIIRLHGTSSRFVKIIKPKTPTGDKAGKEQKPHIAGVNVNWKTTSEWNLAIHTEVEDVHGTHTSSLLLVHTLKNMHVYTKRRDKNSGIICSNK